MSDLIKLTGLWENTDKKGDTYFNGSLGFSKILILKNTYKKKDSDPDFNFFIAKKEKNGEQKSDQSGDIPIL